MSLADAVPNLLIGLREGLEAGLVVSILLAAVRKIATPERRVSTAPIWLGVLGALTVAGSFAAILTFSTGVLSSNGQEAVGGLLSVVAVGLVTAMVFWMRRSAAGLSGRLRGQVQQAADIGLGALALTAFLAVGREGLETTLFLWTAVRASGQTVAPLAGAAVGLAVSVVLCALLYRKAIKLDLGVFFSRTAIGLIVIAAGVLSYGLGDLQDAGLLPGQRWVAFDLSAHLDPNSWWVSLLTGVTDLAPKMSVLQVVSWLVYLAVVLPMFLRAGSSAPSPAPLQTANRAEPGRWERVSTRRPVWVACTLVLVPVAIAAVSIAVLPSAAAATANAVTVTNSGCAPGWTGGQAGLQSFSVSNRSGRAGEIDLLDAAGGIVAEIETLGPGTTAEMTATLTDGSYRFQCLLSGSPATTSATVAVTGSGSVSAPAAVAAVRPVTTKDLTAPNDAYQAYAAGDLAALATRAAALEADLARGDEAGAKVDLEAAQLDWELVGASYDSFGDAGVAIDGLPDGLPLGVQDKNFTGLHRLEYGLWHGQSAPSLLPVARTLSADIASLRKNLTSDDIAGDPTNLPIRAHEILEDALRDHLSGIDDEGAHSAYAQTAADLQVTTVVLAELAPLITARAPSLMATADRQAATLRAALSATGNPDARERIDAALGALLETLSAVPDLLEVPVGQ